MRAVDKIATGKASNRVGTFPRSEPPKRRVCLGSRMSSASCGPCFPLREARIQVRAWHRPGIGCVYGRADSALFPANYGTQRVVPTGHFSEYRLRERGSARYSSVSFRACIFPNEAIVAHDSRERWFHSSVPQSIDLFFDKVALMERSWLRHSSVRCRCPCRSRASTRVGRNGISRLA